MKFNFFKKSLVPVIAVLAATSVAAHPGHGFLDEGLLHLFTSPDHLLLMAGVGIALILLGKLTLGLKARLHQMTKLVGWGLVIGAVIVGVMVLF